MVTKIITIVITKIMIMRCIDGGVLKWLILDPGYGVKKKDLLVR